MAKIRLEIGSFTTYNSGIVTDTGRPVEFEGVLVAELSYYTGGSDARGVRERLYGVDGRMVVHVEAWSNWVGEPNTYSLYEVTDEDLGVDGKFEELGRQAGLGRCLTLDEALGG